jgi:hypothetical protein
MIKLLAAGLWACIVTLGASYVAFSWQAPVAFSEPQSDAAQGGLETVRTRMISVPVIRSGVLQGYVMAQFSFTIDAATLKRLAVKPDVVVIDEGFKAIYADDVDFRNLKKQDLGGLAKRIVEASNQRLGMRAIEDAFIQEFSYLTKDGVRMGNRRGT